MLKNNLVARHPRDTKAIVTFFCFFLLVLKQKEIPKLKTFAAFLTDGIK